MKLKDSFDINKSNNKFQGILVKRGDFNFLRIYCGFTRGKNCSNAFTIGRIIQISEKKSIRYQEQEV